MSTIPELVSFLGGLRAGETDTQSTSVSGPAYVDFATYARMRTALR